MAAVQGPYPTLDDPTEAVAAACALPGAKPDHVDVELHAADPTGCPAWRWQLTSDAPVVELRDVLVFDTVVDCRGRERATGRAHHPRLAHGIVVAVDGGYLVVADDEDESIEDLIEAGMREAQIARRS